jgi:hypothetical protein
MYLEATTPTEDGGWESVYVLSRRTLTARKEHLCDGITYAQDRICRKPIKPGERYERKFLLWDDGSTMEMKRHKTCYISH